MSTAGRVVPDHIHRTPDRSFIGYENVFYWMGPSTFSVLLFDDLAVEALDLAETRGESRVSPPGEMDQR